MRIVIAGPKGAGKSAVGARLAALLELEAVETDRLLEDLFTQCRKRRLSCREIFREFGAEFFRGLEEDAVRLATARDNCVIITGGSTLLNPESRALLRQNSRVVLLTGDAHTLYQRATANGVPPWLDRPDGAEIYAAELREREAAIRPIADVVLDSSRADPQTLAEQARRELLKPA